LYNAIETRPPPAIIHSSIARHLKEVDLGQVQEVISRHKIFIEEEVAEFKLLRYEILPLQKYKVLRGLPFEALCFVVIKERHKC
jgi:hypothetical protein